MSLMIDRVAKAILVRAAQRGHNVSPVVVNHLAAAAIEAMRPQSTPGLMDLSDEIVNRYISDALR